MPEPNVFIFWDNSNIFISAKQVAEARDGALQKDSCRINFTNLMNLAKAGRPVNAGGSIVVGSVPPSLSELWTRMEATTGIRIERYERGEGSGTEQGLDQCIQVHMLRAISDNKDPQIAVLLTGDGAGAEDGVGFFADLKRMREAGWGVEVLSWNHSCNSALKNWAESEGAFIKLDDYYNSITFIDGVRPAAPLSLTSRKKSTPVKKESPKNDEAAKSEKSANEEIAKLRKLLADKDSEIKKLNKKAYGKKVNISKKG
ncbi:MAG TPA: NYN domain-containing protein [Nitratidesulfovibrio sp.]|nr:NYN domain-containing protein [Nitratidesulfovibrio sp.]